MFKGLIADDDVKEKSDILFFLKAEGGSKFDQLLDEFFAMGFKVLDFDFDGLFDLLEADTAIEY